MVTPAIVNVPASKNSVPQGFYTLPSPAPVRRRPDVDHGPAADAALLSGALLENHRIKSSSKTLDIIVALVVHVTLIGAPILAGLYYTDTINLKQMVSTLLVAPPPPPPPPPAPAAAVMKQPSIKRVFMNNGKLTAPRYVPQHVAEIKEAPLESDAFEGGVPGGVAGGQMGGVLGGIIGGTPRTIAKPTGAPASKQPVRVGGRVRQPRLITQVPPRYPPLALQSHLSGDVVIDTILDENGNVTDMNVVSGNPLLFQEALAAVSKWKYEPTYLNEEPISIRLIVTVRFRMPN